MNHDGTAGGANGAPVGGLDVWDVLAPGLDCSTVVERAVRTRAGDRPDHHLHRPRQPRPASLHRLVRVEPAAGDVGAVRRRRRRRDRPGRAVHHPLRRDGPRPGGRLDRLPRHGARAPLPAAHQRHRSRGPGRCRSTRRRTSTPRCCRSCRPVPWPATAPRSGCARPSWRRPAPRRSPSRTTTPPTRRRSARLVTYRYSVVIPAGTEVNSGSLADTLPSGIVQQGPATLAFYPNAGQPGTAAPPAGVALDPATGTGDLRARVRERHRHRPALRGALPRPGHADGHHGDAERRAGAPTRRASRAWPPRAATR